MGAIFFIDETTRKFGPQVVLNYICCVRSGTILSKVVFLEIRHLTMSFPKEIFEHLQIVVLIY